ncbi:hypothetical protein C8R45DRAFT_1220595 [Mycena sanguinolenta]|nr:hypothetical protein C8R45DRAFT_1220595 [Mycena sanguinolenta]
MSANRNSDLFSSTVHVLSSIVAERVECLQIRPRLNVSRKWRGAVSAAVASTYLSMDVSIHFSHRVGAALVLNLALISLRWLKKNARLRICRVGVPGRDDKRPQHHPVGAMGAARNCTTPKQLYCGQAIHPRGDCALRLRLNRDPAVVCTAAYVDLLCWEHRHRPPLPVNISPRSSPMGCRSVTSLHMLS